MSNTALHRVPDKASVSARLVEYRMHSDKSVKTAATALSEALRLFDTGALEEVYEARFPSWTPEQRDAARLHLLQAVAAGSANIRLMQADLMGGTPNVSNYRTR